MQCKDSVLVVPPRKHHSPSFFRFSLKMRWNPKCLVQGNSGTKQSPRIFKTQTPPNFAPCNAKRFPRDANRVSACLSCWKKIKSWRFSTGCGVIAQLVEHLVRNEKVRGSNPLDSTILFPVFRLSNAFLSIRASGRKEKKSRQKPLLRRPLCKIFRETLQSFPTFCFVLSFKIILYFSTLKPKHI